jgi:fatty-acyl-CoA synthase
MDSDRLFPELSVYQLLERAVAEQPDRPAVVFQDRRLSYGELGQRVERLAARLAGMGVRRGDHLGILLPNWPEFVEAYFAISRLGATIVPFGMRLGSVELEELLRQGEVKLLIAAAGFGGVDYRTLLGAMWPRLPALERVVLVGAGESTDRDDDRIVRYQDLIDHRAAVPAPPPVPVDPRQDVALVLFTSGTTSTPKGVTLSHRNIVWTAFNENQIMRITRDDRFLLVVPFSHVFGAVVGILCAVAGGAAMVLMDRFKSDEVLATIERERASILYGTPTMFVLQLNSPQLAGCDLTSLRTGIIAAAPCPVEVVKAIMSRMHCDIAISYGLTETSPALTATTFDDSPELRASTVGKALPGIELRVVDDERRPVPPGTVGELACRGYAVMKGYYRQPGLTAEIIDQEGWLYTGDLASLDRDGYVRICGRKKDMIKRGGFAIFPVDVENYIHTHPCVQEVAIIGVPDPVLGEVSRAYLVLKPGARLTGEELLDFCRGKLADYKLPDQIRFVETLPMTPSGKVQKAKLRESAG